MTRTELDSPATTVTPTSTTITRLARTRWWAGRIGGLALIGLGTAHTVTNAIGFAAQPGGSWPLFLLFGPGLGVLLAAIGVLAWRQSTRSTVGWPVRVALGLAALFCGVAVVNVLRTHPEFIWVPAGPGPWSALGTPTLLALALLPTRSRR